MLAGIIILSGCAVDPAWICACGKANPQFNFPTFDKTTTDFTLLDFRPSSILLYEYVIYYIPPFNIFNIYDMYDRRYTIYTSSLVPLVEYILYVHRSTSKI